MYPVVGNDGGSDCGKEEEGLGQHDRRDRLRVDGLQVIHPRLFYTPRGMNGAVAKGMDLLDP